jgi:hypothetical protein
MNVFAIGNHVRDKLFFRAELPEDRQKRYFVEADGRRRNLTESRVTLCARRAGTLARTSATIDFSEIFTTYSFASNSSICCHDKCKR